MSFITLFLHVTFDVEVLEMREPIYRVCADSCEVSAWNGRCAYLDSDNFSKIVRNQFKSFGLEKLPSPFADPYFSSIHFLL